MTTKNFTEAQKAKHTKIYTSISAIIIILMIIFDNLNVFGLPAKEAAWVGFIAMTLQLISAGVKQYLSPTTSNKSLYYNIALFVAFLATGILNQFDLVPLSAELQGGLRTVLVLLSTSLPKILKQLNPGDENISSEENKEETKP